jgi:fructose-1,6-bisphosphatase
VFEEAGGLASNGLSRILDLPVADIHQRTPFYVGSFEDIVMLEKYHKFYL